MRILPIFIPHQGCDRSCIYCNQNIITGYAKPDFENISNQITNFCNHKTPQKTEIAFFGGTFTNLTRKYQLELIKLVESFYDRIDGIRISTIPDKIDENILSFCLDNHISTIELGVQSFSDNVLNISGRKYTKKTVIKSAKLIQKVGINLGVQLMPGLPESNEKTLENTIKETIKINPEFVRIYPTIVLKHTKLAKLFQNGSYNPLSLDKAVDIVSKMKMKFEQSGIDVIKMGLHSDIDFSDIVAGPYHQSFGELVKSKILSEEILLNYKKGKTLAISNQDISLFKGFKASMLNLLKEKLQIKELPIFLDKKLKSEEFYFSDEKAMEIW
ncbi:MAG: radical SAM protein [Candidatus Cloacimonetes bacterium]|nr:radical SAM protein [Candidatus Cloacimonadota bacterium]